MVLPVGPALEEPPARPVEQEHRHGPVEPPVAVDFELLGRPDLAVGGVVGGGEAGEVVVVRERHVALAGRHRFDLVGVAAALVLRILFALIVVQLLQIVGLIFAGGLLLLWVAWKMWRELHHLGQSPGSPEIEGDESSGIKSGKSFYAAAWAVAVAGRTHSRLRAISMARIMAGLSDKRSLVGAA